VFGCESETLQLNISVILIVGLASWHSQEPGEFILERRYGKLWKPVWQKI